MLDLETYRRRVGSFIPSGRRRSRIKGNMPLYRGHKWEQKLFYNDDETIISFLNVNWKVALLLVTLVTLISTIGSVYVLEDGRSAKNRQRQIKFREFKYLSDAEKKTFNNIRTEEAKLTRASSHLEFFKECEKRQLLVTNLEYNGNFNVALADKEVQDHLKDIDRKNAMEKMKIAISHLRMQIPRLNENVTEKYSSLRSMCSENCFDLLSSMLSKHKSKLSNELACTKQKKLQKLLSSSAKNASTVSNPNSWLPALGLTMKDRQELVSNKDLDDFVIFTAMNMIVSDYPMLHVQAPSLIHSSGYEYCPFETIQITHTRAHHWVMLSSIGGEIKIYDSLQMTPTTQLKSQIIQLFSPDEGMPAYRIMDCQKQVGSHDCGVFAIAFAVEVLSKGDISDTVFDQSKMRTHLISCLETGKLVPFPKYCIQPNGNSKKSSTPTDSEWKILRRSARLQTQSQSSQLQKKENGDQSKKALPEKNNPPCNAEHSQPKIMIQNDTIQNLSSVSLSPAEISVLEKGLNFCPTVKAPNAERLLDDIYFFCRKLKLKEYFPDPSVKQIPEIPDC